MTDGRFRPPSLPDLPADVVPPRTVAMGEAATPTATHEPKPHKPRVYRRPRTTPLLVWLLALVGAAVIFAALTKGVRRVFETPMEVAAWTTASAPKKDWKPVASGHDEVLVNVKTWPKQAQILLDGQPASSNPLLLPRSDRVHDITVMAPGYAPQTVRQSAAASATVTVKLAKRSP